MAIDAQGLQAEWNTLREHVKQRWNQLADDDLYIHDGDVDQLIGRIQQKTGETRETVEHFLGDLISRSQMSISKATETIGGYAKRAGEQLREGDRQVAEQAQERYRRAQTVVRHHPTESVVLAFGVGLVAGVVVGLALRSR